MAVGKHLGYLWAALAAVALIQSEVLHPLFGVVGLLLAPLLSSGRWSSSAPSSPAAGRWPAPWSRWLYRLVGVAAGLGIGLLLSA